MKSVLISIQPKWCEKIVSGEKTIEVRKTRPKLQTPFKCFIYCTKDSRQHCVLAGDYPKLNYYDMCGSVIGEFICDEILGIARVFDGNRCEFTDNYLLSPEKLEKTCLTIKQLSSYGAGRCLYNWYISELKIYDEPKELSRYGMNRPPQSWCYVEGEEQ